MNKKLFLAMALPVVLAGCSQDDLVSEGVVATAPDAKAIDNVTFTIAKNAGSDGVESRADWVNNKIKFEKSDKVSLYWLGDDNVKPAAATDGSFTGISLMVNGTLNADPLVGNSNAVFRTEDGASFTAEAVVYEGYNLLVYPANVKHTTAANVVVSLPGTQKAADDFAENAIYIGDSILHIHQPAINKVRGNGKEYGAYYDIYGHKATTEDPNTSGYAHGVKTGVKLLTSLLNMDLRIVNAPANDVKIQQVVLTTAGDTKQFNEWGNLSKAGTVANPIGYVSRSGSKAQFTNPWFKANENGKTDAVTLSFDGVTTNVSGSTKGTMLLLPTNINVASFTTTNQPVLKVYTNYGVVTIGGNVAANDAQSNAIYKKDGIEKAADNDNLALQDIVKNATSYTDKLDVYDSEDNTDKKQDYVFNSGVSMTRVIKVDMAKAEMIDMKASTTEELNSILKAAVTNPNNKFTGSNQLSVALIPNNDGEFTLTNYEGLDAFVNKFKAGSLSLTAGTNAAGATTETVVMNTTSATELKDVDGLADAITLTIPATSMINAVKNGTDAADAKRHRITNPIVNESTITIPAYATITLADNEDGKVIYTKGAVINQGTGLTDENYGIVYYEATTKNEYTTAVAAGVNYVKIDGLGNAFFAEGLSDTGKTAKTGLTIEFSNCGKLNETVESGVIDTETIVLSNGTTYPDLTGADVTEIIVKSATAELGYPKVSSNPTAKPVSKIVIEEGKTTIKYLNITTLEVKEGATADMDKNTEAPENLYVFGTASFCGDNKQGSTQVVFVDSDEDGKINAINTADGTSNKQCVVTGTLNLANDLAYNKVAVAENTKINVAEGVTGLGYKTHVYVTKDPQAKGTANLKYIDDPYSATKTSWNGNFSDLTGWTGI